MASPESIRNPIKELFKQEKVALVMNVRLARSSDFAFLLAEGSRVTGELHTALG